MEHCQDPGSSQVRLSLLVKGYPLLVNTQYACIPVPTCDSPAGTPPHTFTHKSSLTKGAPMSMSPSQTHLRRAFGLSTGFNSAYLPVEGKEHIVSSNPIPSLKVRHVERPSYISRKTMRASNMAHNRGNTSPSFPKSRTFSTINYFTAMPVAPELPIEPPCDTKGLVIDHTLHLPRNLLRRSALAAHKYVLGDDGPIYGLISNLESWSIRSESSERSRAYLFLIQYLVDRIAAEEDRKSVV